MISNGIEALLAEAGRRRWCTKRFCTTCGATEFRAALRSLAEGEGCALAESMRAMELSAWYEVPDVGGAVGHVFDALLRSSLVDEVLRAWLPRVSDHPRLVDAVIFHVVRQGRGESGTRDSWLATAESVAVARADPSLLETLVYTLRAGVTERADLLRVAQLTRREYKPLDRALSRVATASPRGA